MLETCKESQINIQFQGREYVSLASIGTGSLLQLARVNAGLGLDEAVVLLDLDEDYLWEIEGGYVGLAPEMIGVILSTYDNVINDNLELDDY